MKWYRLAAEQGDAQAQNNLGLMYDAGQGVPQVNAEALKWYRLAAEQGDAGSDQCRAEVVTGPSHDCFWLGLPVRPTCP